MVNLVHTYNYIAMFAIAATFGALGGVTHLLIEADSNVSRREQFTGTRVFASLFIGAAASIAITYFLPPEVIVQKVDGTEVRHWEIVKLVSLSLSLIVGAGGKAIFAALQAQVLGAVKDYKIEAGPKVAAAATQQALDDVAARAVDATADASRDGVAAVVRSAALALPPDLHNQLVSHLGPTYDEASVQTLAPADADRHLNDADQALMNAKASALEALQPEIDRNVAYVQQTVAAVSS